MELTKIIHIGEKLRKTKDIKISKLAKIEIAVIFICLILGTILHFTYQWSGKNIFVASFSAVNESVWEHLKLVFFPMFISAIVEYSFVKEIVHNYIEAKTIGIFIAICFIVVTFFTYTGILGTNLFVIDILIFIASISLGEYSAYRLMKRRNESYRKTKILASIIILFLFVSFIICTYLTPKVNLFRDPTNGVYGISSN